MRFVILLLLALPAFAQPMPVDAPRPGWGDEDHDCIDTRHEILIRDAIAGSVRMSENGCRVTSGLWPDPYGGGWVSGNPGGRPVAQIEVDHVIPQSQARTMREWTREEFEAFYNDPLNLVAVSRSENQLKRAKLISAYIPPNPHARCWFVWRVAAVRKKYHLALPPLEMVVLKEWQERCD